MENNTLVEIEEIPLNELIVIVKKYILYVLALALLVGAAAFFISARQPKVYRATSKIIVNFDESAVAATEITVQPPPLDLDTYREVALSPSLLEQAFGPLDPGELEAITSRINFETMEGRRSGLLILRVKLNDPVKAADEANRWAKALLAWEEARALGTIRQQEESLRAQMAAIEHELEGLSSSDERYATLLLMHTELQRELDQLRVLEAGARPRLHLLEPARPPSNNISPRPFLNGLLATVFTSILVFFVVFFKEVTSPYIKDPEEASRLTGLPVLAEFPRLPPQQNVELPRETASFLKTGLQQILMDDDPSLVLITSAVEGEGKTSVALALAHALAQGGKPTLLVDADLRMPSIQNRLRLPKGPGLLRALTTLEDVARQVAPALYVVTCSAPSDDSAEILGEHFKSWLRHLADVGSYRYIVIDTAPLLPVADTLILAPHATTTLLVVSEGKTTKRNLTNSVELLRGIGVRPGGLVMNRVRDPSTVFVGGYGGYVYGYRQKKQRIHLNPDRHI